jgi:shikimate dehydrogenase
LNAILADQKIELMFQKHTNTYGLIGYPLTHSFSPGYFKQKFEKEGISDSQYLLFEMESLDQLRDLTTLYPSIKGLNVTIPHKETILPFLDAITPEAQQIGAVNTIQIQHGKWIGHNTDVIGFRASIRDWLDDFSIQTALILGSGGASKAAQFVLKSEGIPFKTVSRKGDFNYGDLNEIIMRSVDLIVNCTPLGMYPDVQGKPPIPYSCLSDKHLLFDMIYNPEKTIFLSRGESYGTRIRNGHSMLQLQAEAAWKIWQSQ